MKVWILIIVLCVVFSACTTQAENTVSHASPPESILYLGGAAILDEFEIKGGPGAFDGTTQIIIRTPTKLEKEGLHFAVIGITEDGTQETLFTESDVVAASYFTIGEEVYCDYVELTLFMDYTWNGILMSMRTINLLTLEEQSSVLQEFDAAD